VRRRAGLARIVLGKRHRIGFAAVGILSVLLGIALLSRGVLSYQSQRSQVGFAPFALLVGAISLAAALRKDSTP
jgi:uncharacterized membrane protein HdeD (DUF308 family)